MKKGDIVLVPFPFTDLSNSKLRSALVLAVAESDIVLVFMTSRRVGKNRSDEIFIRADSQNRLKTDSFVKCSKIATLDRKTTLGILGSITKSQNKEIDNALKKILQLF